MSERKPARHTRNAAKPVKNPINPAINSAKLADKC